MKKMILCLLAMIMVLALPAQSVYDFTVKESPLYTFLKAKAPFKGYPEGYEAFASQLTKIHQQTGSGFEKGNAIKWNFSKFLISKDGQTILRFEPMISPEMLESVIQEMLK